MLAVNYSTIRNNLKGYCDQATDNGETIIVTRKAEKNVVILSLDKYNQLTKAARNAEYLAMIDDLSFYFASLNWSLGINQRPLLFLFK
jgi:antitoxin YefM